MLRQLIAWWRRPSLMDRTMSAIIAVSEARGDLSRVDSAHLEALESAAAKWGPKDDHHHC